MKRILISITLVMMVVCCFAAIKQTGYVKTRGRLGVNGKVIPGTRLGGATVVLRNGSSVASDQAGNFSLTLPSNSFFLKNVKKVGYIVADPDALSKQYAYSSNPLILVLDQPTQQQDDKLASERKLRRNLQKQLQQREDELEALKEEKRLQRSNTEKLCRSYMMIRRVMKNSFRRWQNVIQNRL